MASGVIRGADQAPAAPVVPVGRPPWWLLCTAVLIGGLVTADLLTWGRLELLDLRVSAIASDWALIDSAAYPLVWAVTQVGGRATILIVLSGLVGYLVWRRRTWLPLVRVLLALALLTVTVYSLKYGTGRTAPRFPGSFFFQADGASFPSGHVANAVLMWGVARWQAVEYGLPALVQRAFWVLSLAGPVATGVAMVSLDWHWLTDAIVGAAVGILLLGVVHALNAHILSRYVRAHAGRPSA